MDEAEWLACTNPTSMLIYLRRKASSRKFRLLACECCWQNRLFMAQPGAKSLVVAAEKWADQLATKSDVSAAFEKLDLTSPLFEDAVGSMSLGFCSEDAYVAVNYTIAWATEDDPVVDRQLSELIRDVFGNPFHPSTTDTTWRMPRVKTLAQSIYENRAFDRMAILADALEEAGCTDQDILAHCRSGGEHVRGCWVIDLLLGKS